MKASLQIVKKGLHKQSHSMQTYRHNVTYIHEICGSYNVECFSTRAC